MNTISPMRNAARPRPAQVALAAACTLALALPSAGPATASAQVVANTTPTDTGGVTATLEQCVTSVVQAERSATFTGEMSSIAGATKMTMRIDVEERLPGEVEFHPVAYPGLGVWRAADPKVKVYKYLKQVTNLSSPASYRGDVRFHWINAKGHVIKRAERMTSRCLQPASPNEQPPAAPQATSPSTTTVTPST
jgi:hypothetical protein